MTTRTYSAKTTPALWFSLCAACLLAWTAGLSAAGPAPQSKRKTARRKPAATAPAGPTTLATLVRAYRQGPTPARRSAVTAYAAAHPKEAPLANLALGVSAYEQRDFAAAIGYLQKLNSKIPQIADYAGYYLAASRVESGDTASVPRDLLPTRSLELPSPMAARSWLLDARAQLKSNQAEAAIRALREHFSALPQPEGDLVLGDCYQAIGDRASAAESYQRVYYLYAAGDASTRAAAALVTLKDSLADKYPQPSTQLMLRHADRLLDLRDLVHARSEYESLLDRPQSLARDEARVRLAAADYFAGKVAAAIPYLAQLEVAEPEADAERLYYLVECQRHQGDDEQMKSALRALAKKHAGSPWRLRALISAANRYLLVNRPEEYVPLYRDVYENFPTDASAATAHWKVAFRAWMQNGSDAGDLLREHLRRYPNHATTGAALYFLGRDAEERHEPGDARVFYQKLATIFENHYYAMRARERLARSEVRDAAPSSKAEQFLANLTLPVAKPVSMQPTRPTTLRIERSRLLRAAGLSDLADSELRFGARTDCQAAIVGMEMASAAEAPHQAMHAMKGMSPEYLNLPLEDAPRRYWELLFPLPYRSELMADAEAHSLDPYLLAGLIRQESEFDPKAISRAKAYGLTQVRPGTGRQFARSAGVSRFSTSLLFQPAVNLKIGAAILRSMLDQNGGHLEQTLAAYNAGPARLADWLKWNTYREPAEFVESIPFTETRDYVQAVLRNADIYRRLYR